MWFCGLGEKRLLVSHPLAVSMTESNTERGLCGTQEADKLQLTQSTTGHRAAFQVHMKPQREGKIPEGTEHLLIPHHKLTYSKTTV